MSRWIDLDSEEVQSLIIEDDYGNQYLDMDELNEVCHWFPDKPNLDDSGILKL